MNTVLFACVHNAGRSQMAAAFFNELADPTRASAISAGTDPGERVHPGVVDAMRELGCELANVKPRKLTDELAARASLLITMGCGEACPFVPGLERQDWALQDPKGQSADAVRRIRDEIRQRVARLVAERNWDRETATRQRVLFLCSGNSARSQMAEVLLRHHAGDRFDVRSAGLVPRDIHSLTHVVLQEVGLDTRGLRPKGIKELMGKEKFQYAIIVCPNAAEQCPHVFPFALRTLTWPFEDPAAFSGTEEEQLEKFREVRDSIDDRIRRWLAEAIRDE